MGEITAVGVLLAGFPPVDGGPSVVAGQWKAWNTPLPFVTPEFTCLSLTDIYGPLYSAVKGGAFLRMERIAGFTFSVRLGPGPGVSDSSGFYSVGVTAVIKTFHFHRRGADARRAGAAVSSWTFVLFPRETEVSPLFCLSRGPYG